MSDATVKRRTDYTARKATLEAERDAFTQAANARIAELKRTLDDYVAQANGTLSAMNGRVEDHAEFLRWLDTLDAEDAATMTPEAPDAANEFAREPPG
jgi:CHASE1-domain containing sensor protein